MFCLLFLDCIGCYKDRSLVVSAEWYGLEIDAQLSKEILDPY